MGRLSEYSIWHKNEYGEWPTSDEEMDVDRFLACEAKNRQIIARWTSEDLESPSVVKDLKLYSPSAQVIFDIKNKKISLDELHWREFEELVAELLRKTEWEVQLGKGSKDGGVDILAEREVPGIGIIRTIWQAKHYSQKRKVGLQEIRELHSVVVDNKVSKGIIVTSTHLTRGAIERIDRDKYQLGHAQRPALLNWIESTK